MKVGGARLEEEQEPGLGQGGGGVMCRRQHGTQEASGWLGLSTRVCKVQGALFVSGGTVAMVQIASLSLDSQGDELSPFLM